MILSITLLLPLIKHRIIFIKLFLIFMQPSILIGKAILSLVGSLALTFGSFKTELFRPDRINRKMIGLNLIQKGQLKEILENLWHRRGYSRLRGKSCSRLLEYIELHSNSYAELQAVLVGSKICKQLHLSKVWIEINSKVVINLMK